MLHSRFAEIASPLRFYIDELFKETAYHEAFLFRGLYFVGDTLNEADRANVVAGPESWDSGAAAMDGEPRLQRPPASGGDIGEPKPGFVHQLLERKIFPWPSSTAISRKTPTG